MSLKSSESLLFDWPIVDEVTTVASTSVMVVLLKLMKASVECTIKFLAHEELVRLKGTDKICCIDLYLHYSYSVFDQIS